jgi:predicted enzyme related to lactoylglutathione lyase
VNEQTQHEPQTGDEHGVDAGLATPGAITYLHIAAKDVRQAAIFYGEVFGWNINNLDSDRPSFDDTSGRLSGAWLNKHLAVTEAGLLPYIYVDQIDDTVSRIRAHGGDIVTAPYPEGLLTVAAFRDPAGNVIGIWHDTTR